MTHPVTVELSAEAYAGLQLRAREVAKSPSEVAAATLEKQFAENGKVKLTEEERQAARDRFTRHFGEVDLGYPTGTDNERIDADLAREYENGDEGS